MRSGEDVRVYSYIVRHDTGFAPNPFHGICSLACCKSAIRATAKPGDVIVGLSARAVGVVYAMQVDQVVSFEEYWTRPEFRCKRPSAEGIEQSVGDNIYEPSGHGYRQVLSRHSNPDGSEHLGNKQQDLRSPRVLIGRNFSYFGRRPARLPTTLAFLRVGRGHRCNFSGAEVRHVGTWFAGLPKGLIDQPAEWPEGSVDAGTRPGCR